MNFDEFMNIFNVGTESEEDLTDTEDVTTDPVEAEAEAEAEADSATVTATDDNNSAELDGDDDSNAFISEEKGEEEPEEADVDLDPASDILERIAEDEEASGFDKQMEIPTVVDEDTVFDKLQDQTDVQVHNNAEKERAVLADLEAELDEVLTDSGDTYEETDMDEIPENPSAEKTGGVDPLESPDHPITDMINDRVEDMEENEMLIVSTKDEDMDASEFLADEINDDDTYAHDGSDECECSNCEETAETEPETVTEDEDEDVVPKDAEPEDDEKEESSDDDVDVEAEAEKLEDDSDEATDEKIEAGDTSDLEVSGDEAPAEDADDDGESEEGNIFDDPETFEITDDVVDNVRMPEYTFVPSVTLDEHNPEEADAEREIKVDDVEVQEVEGGDDTPLGASADDAAPSEDTDAEAEADVEEDAEAEADVEEDAEAEADVEVTKEEPAEIVEEEEEVKPAEECGDTDVVPTDAEPEEEPAAPAEGDAVSADSDVETISADIKNDDEANIQELYKEVDAVVTVGDDETALDGSSFVVDGDDTDEAETPAEPSEHHNDPTELQDIEEVEMDSQDLSDVLEDLLDEPHNFDDEGSSDDVPTEDAPAEAEVESEPTEDAETEETSEEEEEADDIDVADEAIEALFADLENFTI